MEQFVPDMSIPSIDMPAMPAMPEGMPDVGGALSGAMDDVTGGVGGAFSGALDGISGITSDMPSMPSMPDMPSMPSMPDGMPSMPSMPDGIPSMPDGMPNMGGAFSSAMSNMTDAIPTELPSVGMPDLSGVSDSVASSTTEAGIKQKNKAIDKLIKDKIDEDDLDAASVDEKLANVDGKYEEEQRYAQKNLKALSQENPKKALSDLQENQEVLDLRDSVSALDPGLGKAAQEAAPSSVAADPAETPWHASNRPSGADASWEAECEAWCGEVARDRGLTLRNHIKCEACAFRFIYRTSNWSWGSDSDVENKWVCCNPLCKQRGVHWS